MAKPAIVIHIEDDVITAVYGNTDIDCIVVLSDSNGLEKDHPHYHGESDCNVWREEVEKDYKAIMTWGRIADELAAEAKDGTSGQDRDSYSDTQDRENYSAD